MLGGKRIIMVASHFGTASSDFVLEVDIIIYMYCLLTLHYASVCVRKRGIWWCVCVSVCVDCYSCSRINDVQVSVSIGF